MAGGSGSDEHAREQEAGHMFPGLAQARQYMVEFIQVRVSGCAGSLGQRLRDVLLPLGGVDAGTRFAFVHSRLLRFCDFGVAMRNLQTFVLWDG